MKNRSWLEAVRARVVNRLYIEVGRLVLELRRRLAGGVCWVHGGPVLLPVVGDGDRQMLHYSLYGKKWWSFEKAQAERFVKPGAVVVDVGANIGFLSALFSSLVGESGRVFAFEPSPEVFKKLCMVAEKNHLANVRTIEAGCGSRAGMLTLYSPRFSGNSTLRPEGVEGKVEGDVHQQKVEILKLDEFFGVGEGTEDFPRNEKLSRLDFVKIDTEGFEDEVLRGMEGLIEKFRPVIYIELCAQFRSSSERAIQILHLHGYRFERAVDLDTSENGDNYFALPALHAADAASPALHAADATSSALHAADATSSQELPDAE
jgi:FkbM family methyltransferase